MIDAISVESTKNVLSTFSCNLNEDIEIYLKEKAIKFSDQAISQTHLVLGDSDGDIELLGYFALANKILTIVADDISNTVTKKIEKFAIYDEHTNAYQLPAPLIAQLGRNFSPNLKHSITGGNLLELACGKVALIQKELSGKLVYVEAEDAPKLIDFYINNGFRPLETRTDTHLVRLIKYL